MSSKQKVMVQPINVIFRYLQQQTPVCFWLYDNVETRIEGKIIGFDEHMSVVCDDATEVHIKSGSRQALGRILLKGDNITLVQPLA